MIQAEVTRNGRTIMSRTYYEPSLTLEKVIAHIEMYIVGEKLNLDGECNMRVRFSNVHRQSA